MGFRKNQNDERIVIMQQKSSTTRTLTVICVTVIIVSMASMSLFKLPFPSMPFHNETKDTSLPPIALQLAGIKEFHAARGTFSVVVDLENDTSYVPSVLLGTKATMTAQGTVDAYVDFSSVTIVGDTVHLPAPRFSAVTVDNSKTKVVGGSKGILNRLYEVFKSMPDNEQALYLAAESKIADAAVTTGLSDMARETTREVVAAMVAPRIVTVVFDDEMAGPSLSN